MFFECDDNPQDLPSFPTRRSSDLDHYFADDNAADDEPPAIIDAKVWAATLGAGAAAGGVAVLNGRSEEHTSELQSRRDLVCRLRVEKKKSANRARTVSW